MEVAQSDAETVDQYLLELPDDRKDVVQGVRKIVLDNLPDGYQETMQYGMISYVIPLKTYPKTYNRQPLSYVSLSSQKNYISLYLMSVYSDVDTEKWFD